MRTWSDEADDEIILLDGLTETAMAHPFLLQPDWTLVYMDLLVSKENHHGLRKKY